MKNINLIASVPPKKKKEVYRWIVLSSLLLFGTLMTIGSLIFSRWYAYASLKKQHAELIPNELEYKKTLETAKEKEQNYVYSSQKLAKIRHYISHPKNPVTLLKACSQKIGKHALQSCAITPETIELQYTSPSTSAAQKTLHLLEAIPEMHAVQLTSLQKQNTNFVSTIRGALKTPRS